MHVLLRFYNFILADGLRIRFARRGTLIPNAELKFAKTELEKEVLRDDIKVILSKEEIIIPKIEQHSLQRDIFGFSKRP